MERYALDLALPWSGLQEEDRRFRRILLANLIAFSLIGGITAQLSVPSMPGTTDQHLPPRIAYIIDAPANETPGASPPRAAADEPSAPAPPGRTTEPPSEAAEGTAPAAAAPQAPEPSPTAREMAASAGVLAFGDALRDLREAATPRVSPTATIQGPHRIEGNRASSERSVLMAGLSLGSGGIDDDVSGHGEVLGSTGLPGEKGLGGSGAGSRLSGSGSPVPGPARASKQRRIGRSQEEIQEILDRNKGRMYALYNRELRRNPALQGKVVVSITIAPSGTVTACTMVFSELDASSLEQKLIVLIKGINFGNKPQVPAVTTKVPIEFFRA